MRLVRLILAVASKCMTIPTTVHPENKVFDRRNLYIITNFLKVTNNYLTFFLKIVALWMVSTQELFIIKSGF